MSDYVSMTEWREQDIKAYYSKCVEFHRFMIDSGTPFDHELLRELRYLIEDAFTAILDKDTWFYRSEVGLPETIENSDESSRLFEQFYNDKQDWLNEHPEWYSQKAAV